ncbi:hypothetical protein FLGE108171_07550 [Flavobacterium gelidilacus]|uniref:hypothetical protein n=1 Tax=Flavobacterium gelidilacus TaxID=206041 RepID=UPI00041A4C90|nr:hypothetical protein [Flavobacterium gelidilacus]
MKGILSNIDSLDVEDFLTKLENSFQVKFTDEVSKLNSFGDLIDLVNGKLSLKNEIEYKSCTSHYLFNKVKKIIIDFKIFNDENIQPITSLNKIFPLLKRKKSIKFIENELGLKLDVLRTPHIYSFFILLNFIFLISSFFHDLFSTNYIIVGILSFITLSFLGRFFTLDFKDKTFGNLIKRIARDNYIESKKDKNFFNPNEVEKNIKALFVEEFGFYDIKITRETKF